MILERVRRNWGRLAWVVFTNGLWILFLGPPTRPPLQFFGLWWKAAAYDPVPWVLGLIPICGIALELVRGRVAAYINGGYWLVLSGLLSYALIATRRGIAQHSPNLDLFEGLQLIRAILPLAVLIALVDIVLYWEPWRRASQANRV